MIDLRSKSQRGCIIVYCIICGEPFLRLKKSSMKRKRIQNIRRRDSVTCSKECARTYVYLRAL